MALSTILSIVSAAVALIRFLVTFANERKWINAGAAEATLKTLKDQDDAIARAKKARDTARTSIDRDPSGVLRDDDGFRRPD